MSDVTNNSPGLSVSPTDCIGNPYVLCNDVFKIYKIADLEVVALRGLDLRVNSGEIIAIVGASGSGKSTLLNILAGYDNPSAGSISVGQYNLLDMKSEEITAYRRREIGFVWQQTERNLFGYLTARENIEVPMMIAGGGRKATQKRTDFLLASVGLLDRADHPPQQLSGGEQQRVAIAVALANEPSLLLADEPTGELDDRTGTEILDLLNNICVDFGTTIIIVTHDSAISKSVGRAISIRDGKTSTETRRPIDFGTRIGGKAAPGDKFYLVDASGRIQLPPEILEKMDIHDRVRIEMGENHVILRNSDDNDTSYD